MSPSYHRPKTIAEAIALKTELGPEAVFLAGGTEVNNRLAAAPVALIDLAGLGLDAVERTSSAVRIGACVTFQQLVEHPDIPWHLKTAARQMVNRNIRNRATVGGHLGINRSCADLIPTLLAAQATVTLVNREVPLEEFLVGEPELILSVSIPTAPRGFGLFNMTRTASDVSLVAASASLALDEGTLRNPILAMGGVAPHVVRLHAVERQLDGQPVPSPERLEERIAQAVQPMDDQRGSAAYKRHIAAVLGARAVLAAVEQAGTTEGGG